MTEIKILKIGSTSGYPEEHDSANDDIIFNDIEAGNQLSVTSGVTITTDIAFNAVTDTIAGIQNQNLVDKSASETISGSWTYTGTVDVNGGDLVLPLAASGTPASGDTYWDDSTNTLYVYDAGGAAYVNVGATGTASGVVTSYTAGTGGIAQYDAVYISANDTVLKADATTTSTAGVIGFARTAIAASATGEIQHNGVLSGVLTGATAGDTYYLDTTAGAVSSSIPTGSGNNVVKVGRAKNGTDLQIELQFFTIRA